DSILKTARALVEDTKKLVAGAASNQEDLAKSAQDAVDSISRLTDTVKFGAASLGTEQSDAQVMLINAARDVASALSEMISATKFAYGREPNDPSIGALKDSAKNLVSNVTSLLKTVKTVEDESCRGTRALEAAIDSVNQELKMYEGVELPEDR
uniref:VBS domain-containing protein n=1 Tax=Macrostomum lignano TaxID=282301 RepID=A0A1I8G8L1_9PLAT